MEIILLMITVYENKVFKTVRCGVSNIFIHNVFKSYAVFCLYLWRAQQTAVKLKFVGMVAVFLAF